MENKKLISIIKDFVNKANEAATKYLEATKKIRKIKDNNDKDYLCSQWGRYRAYNYVIGTLITEYKLNISFTDLGLIIL